MKCIIKHSICLNTLYKTFKLQMCNLKLFVLNLATFIIVGITCSKLAYLEIIYIHYKFSFSQLLYLKIYYLFIINIEKTLIFVVLVFFLKKILRAYHEKGFLVYFWKRNSYIFLFHFVILLKISHFPRNVSFNHFVYAFIFCYNWSWYSSFKVFVPNLLFRIRLPARRNKSVIC